MAILPIVIAPNPILRTKCFPVQNFDAGLAKLVNDMFDTMYDAPGIGLAAPQINRDCQVIVMDCRSDNDGEPLSEPVLSENPNQAQIALINPIIRETFGEHHKDSEGCLSIPGHEILVNRPESALIEYQDIHGKMNRQLFNGLPARCILHEIDHLNGVMIIDYASQFRRTRILRELRQQRNAPPS